MNCLIFIILYYLKGTYKNNNSLNSNEKTRTRDGGREYSDTQWETLRLFFQKHLKH